MPLYKSGKEPTIDFIYCWAACTQSLSAVLPLTPKGWGTRLWVLAREDASGVELDHSRTREGAPGTGWPFQALCFARLPHSARSTSPRVLHAEPDPALHRRGS